MTEAEKTIQEIKDSVPDEDKAELLYLTVVNKILMGKVDFDSEMIKLEGMDESMAIKARILQKRFVEIFFALISILILTISCSSSHDRRYEEALELYSKLSTELSSDDLVKRGELEYNARKPGFMLSFMNVSCFSSELPPISY